LTERELIEGCVKQRSDCQKIIYDRFSGKMMSLCLRYTNQQQTAEDVFQEGFVRAFDCMHQFKFEGSFEGWLRRVFASVAARHLRKKKIQFDELNEAKHFHQHAVEPAIVSKLSEEEIHRLIRMLPDGYRMVFNLNVIEGYSHDEIAGILGIQPATSRVQLLKARRYLQDLIAKKQNVYSA
jgi:RNA polymerase sigma-70 factor (ECF subfamily)